MADSTRTGSSGQPQYRDSRGDWHDSPSGPSGSSDGGDTGGGGGSGSGSRSISAPTGNARTVAGLMGMAMIFSVIGAEIRAANPTTGGVQVGKAFSEPFVIIGGGTIATVMLTLISDAGETGRKFAVGLAGLAAITALLVNGGPVWKAIDSFVGGKATVPTGATAATKPTTGGPVTGVTGTTPAASSSSSTSPT